MLAELPTVALTRDVPDHALVAGDIGTVVQPIAVLALQAEDIRPLQADVIHARRLAS